MALANQLRAELERFWPGPVGLFSDLDSPISLAFLERYPSPLDARGLGEKRLAAFLKSQHYTNRKTAAQLLERLRSAPVGRAGELEVRRRRSIVLRLLRTLQVMVEQIAELEREIAEALAAHPDGAIFRSFFRGSVICPATLLAEIGDCRARYPHRDAIAADAATRPWRPNRANERARSSAGRATSGCATRWTPCAQQLPIQPLGRRSLRPRPLPRPQPPPRPANTRPRLEPDHLALLDQPHPV